MAFKDKVFALRKQKGWSQEQLAEQLDITRQTVSKWESGLAMPDMGKMTLLSSLFEVSLDELVNDKEIEISPQDGAEAVEESTDVSLPRRKPRKTIVAVMFVLAALIIGTVIWLTSHSPKADELHSTIKEYIDSEQVVTLNQIEPIAVRLLLSTKDIEGNYTDEEIKIAIDACIHDFFEPYTNFNLIYENGDLKYNGLSVDVFQEVQDGRSRLWQGAGTVIIVAEKNSQGTVIEFWGEE